MTACLHAQAPARAESKDEERLREMILSDVLDDRPSVSWEGIAGLKQAKQALQVAPLAAALQHLHICKAA